MTQFVLSVTPIVQNSHIDWIERYIRFHNIRHPKEMNVHEIEAFLTHLAVQRNVAPSTQNQALSALLFLYREILKIELIGRIDAVRAKPEKHLPVVLTKVEVVQVLDRMTGLHQMMAKLFGHCEACDTPHLSPLLCYTSP